MNHNFLHPDLDCARAIMHHCEDRPCQGAGCKNNLVSLKTQLFFGTVGGLRLTVRLYVPLPEHGLC
jgi:hypothetical protein